MATIQDIKQRAQQVKDATQIGENTANRVGGVLVDMADNLENDENQLSSLYPADATPTAGSTKPVQSGGVFREVAEQIMTQFGGRFGVKNLVDVTTGTTVGSAYFDKIVDGRTTIIAKSSSTYRVVYRNEIIKKGTVIHFTGTSTTARAQYYGATRIEPSGNIVGMELNHCYVSIVNGQHDDWFIMPYDGYFFYGYYNQNWSDRLFETVLPKYVDEIPTKNMLGRIWSTLEFNLLIGLSVRYNGTEASYENHYATSYVDISNAKVIRFLGMHYATGIVVDLGYAFFDENKNYIDGRRWNTDLPSGASGQTIEYVVMVPEGAKYFRCDLNNNYNYLDRFYCEKLSELVDITNSSNPEENTLAKSLEVMSLKSKLEGISLIEDKILPVLNSNYFNNKFFNGSNGLIVDSTSTGEVSGVLIVNVVGVNKIRFLGLKRNAAGGTMGYGLSSEDSIDIDSAQSQCSYYNTFDYDTSLSSSILKEYIIDIPEGIKWFICTIAKSGTTPLKQLMTINSFYCYTQVGKTVKDEINEVRKSIGKTEVNLDFDFSDNGKTIWGASGLEGSLANHHATTYIDVGDCNHIRFLGLAYNHVSILTTGYYFYDSNKLPLSGSIWNNDLSTGSSIPFEYLIRVPENAKYFRCDVRNSDTYLNFYCIGLTEVASEIEEVASKIEWYNGFNILQNLLNTKYQYKPNQTAQLPNFNLIHFSDVHGDAISLKRIIDFKEKYNLYIDAMIHTGDCVWVKYEDEKIWNTVEGAKEILNVLGNHDTSLTGGYTSGNIDAQTCYETFMEPYLDDWGLTVGTNISENTNYYYKDYPDYKIRLIVLDLYHTGVTYPTSQDALEQEQLTWLQNTLESARTAATPLHIIVAAHSPERNMSEHLDTAFDSLERPDNMSMDNRLPCFPQNAIAAISDFITAGGKFVCYLCGHLHSDIMRKFSNHDNMLSVSIQTASVMEHYSNRTPATGPSSMTKKVIGQRSEDCFNIVSVDTNNCILTVFRIGQDSDKHARHVGSVTYSYVKNKIISQW